MTNEIRASLVRRLRVEEIEQAATDTGLSAMVDIGLDLEAGMASGFELLLTAKLGQAGAQEAIAEWEVDGHLGRHPAVTELGFLSSYVDGFGCGESDNAESPAGFELDAMSPADFVAWGMGYADGSDFRLWFEAR